MFAKLTLVILLAACIGASLLALRHQRLALAGDIADYHSRINAARQTTWDHQVRIHRMLQPAQLRQAIARRQLELVPLIPEPNINPMGIEHADARD